MFSNKKRYRKENVDALKTRWDIEKVHCLDQIQSFEFYGEDNQLIPSSNTNETVIIEGSEIGIITEFFNRSSIVYLRNK